MPKIGKKAIWSIIVLILVMLIIIDSSMDFIY